MKTLFAAALIAVATPALAQTAPAPAPAPVATAAPAVPATKFNLDTPIETLVADPAAKAVLDKDLGNDVSKHPAYDQFKSMSLSAVAPMSGGAVTDEMLKTLGTDLAAIK
ncbi:MAG: hypothetical protein JWO16_1083 [Sphingomonas bacterium]|nr:hypothetical protein [Sphingomonas bacterium]